MQNFISIPYEKWQKRCSMNCTVPAPACSMAMCGSCIWNTGISDSYNCLTSNIQHFKTLLDGIPKNPKMDPPSRANSCLKWTNDQKKKTKAVQDKNTGKRRRKTFWQESLILQLHNTTSWDRIQPKMGLCDYISEGSTTEHCVGNGIQLAAASAETQAAPTSLPAWIPVCWGKMGNAWCRN